mmetsp:Transcript_2591/g.7623  ORF Transcript_2591/g.7623 Transcript_2591/m.7623 type:complete len:82 (+) Transcript_2591:219-464(+)
MVFVAEGDEVPKANDVTHVATIDRKDVVLIMFVALLRTRRHRVLTTGREDKDAAELCMLLEALLARIDYEVNQKRPVTCSS